MSRYALVIGGVVSTIAEGTPEWAATVGAVPVPDGTAAGPGWTWDGSTFGPPPDRRTLAEAQAQALAAIDAEEIRRAAALDEGTPIPCVADAAHPDGTARIRTTDSGLLRWSVLEGRASRIPSWPAVLTRDVQGAPVQIADAAGVTAVCDALFDAGLAVSISATLARLAVGQAPTVAAVDAALADYLAQAGGAP